MARDLIAKEWDTYELEVVPTDAPDVQRKECRRSFYAGATAFFAILQRAADGGSGNVRDSMALLETELGEFVDDVKRGRA